MDKKYIICIDNTKYFMRINENTFYLSQNEKSAKIFDSLHDAEVVAQSMIGMSKNFGTTDNVKIIEL